MVLIQFMSKSEQFMLTEGDPLLSIVTVGLGRLPQMVTQVLDDAVLRYQQGDELPEVIDSK